MKHCSVCGENLEKGKEVYFYLPQWKRYVWLCKSHAGNIWQDIRDQVKYHLKDI